MKGKLSEYGVLVGEEHQQGRRITSIPVHGFMN